MPDTMNRAPGDPYIYKEYGKYYWKHPSLPVVNGPFLTMNDALDDITDYNDARSARILTIARTCHEVNRVFCAFLGDVSQPMWEQAPEWQRTSAISGVQFHLDNPSVGPSASHDNWMKDKVADGWVYGEVKDPDAKTHPCMVPFSELPPEQQSKDILFRTIVHSIGLLD